MQSRVGLIERSRQKGKSGMKEWFLDLKVVYLISFCYDKEGVRSMENANKIDESKYKS